MTMLKYPSYPWPRCQTRSYHAYQATQSPLFSNSVMLPFDTQVRHECQICKGFHQILKVILEMFFFSAHCTQIWKLNQISMTIISKVARKCIWCCHRVQGCLTAPDIGGKLCRRRQSVIKLATSACSLYDLNHVYVCSILIITCWWQKWYTEDCYFICMYMQF